MASDIGDNVYKFLNYKVLTVNVVGKRNSAARQNSWHGVNEESKLSSCNQAKYLVQTKKKL